MSNVATTGAWRVRTVGRDAVLFLAPVVLALPFIADAILWPVSASPVLIARSKTERTFSYSASNRSSQKSRLADRDDS
jgi:hypothetical protein